ncbi:hypothetical protein FY528_00845 [Hymenobacter lutimineralis]|uniref:Uncharacterized protein n=1 Tax=Hymenobacter lutimineralis TaxID=2606448 RepID=A0A5D6VHV0_9BACT|nr:hypothetical protein [Hymenobacter lutimineralis]TYZ14308.1 hypothetical protein FY528_00845 [Hymenobacter lutimineralis]
MSQQQQPSDHDKHQSPEAAQNPQASTGGVIPGPDQDQNAAGNPEATTSTQENMGDGDGIRGGYGNAEQTNGMEGGEEPKPHNDLTRGGVGD